MGITKICTTFFQIQVTRMSLQRWPAYGNNKKGLWTPKVKTVTGGIQSFKEMVGWKPEVLTWCLNAAKESGLKQADYMGGFVIDEMKI